MWELRRTVKKSLFLLGGVLRARLFTYAGYGKLASSEENGVSVKWQIFVVSRNLRPSSHILLLACKISQFVCSKFEPLSETTTRKTEGSIPLSPIPLSLQGLPQTVKSTIMKSFMSKDIFSESPISHFLLSSMPSLSRFWIWTIATTNGVSLVKTAAEKIPVTKVFTAPSLKNIISFELKNK